MPTTADIKTKYYVNVRSEPDKDHGNGNVLRVVTPGTLFSGVTKQDDWWNDRGEGYIHNSVVDVVVSSIPHDIAINYNVDPMAMQYDSQWQSGANLKPSDCGPACVVTVLRAYTGLDLKIDALSKQVRDPRGFTTANELKALAAQYGLRLKIIYPKTLKDVPCPAICLVNYGKFKDAHVQDKKYNAAHWLVLLKVNDDGSTICHDPDWYPPRMAEGAFHAFDAAESQVAFENVYNKGIVALVIDKV